MTPDVLRVHDLLVYYDTPAGAVTAVNHISFSLKAGERLGLVGESGSGKSTLALSVLRLLKPPGRVAAGEVWLDDVDLMTLAEEDMRQVRLARIALIPQGSMNSLNPVMRIKEQLADAMQDHGVRLSKRDVAERVRDLLQWVGLRPEVADMFPHELSGGMKQRACFAIAISLRPKVIIADEPTSALDVSVQARVLDLFARLQAELGFACLFISHDLAVVDLLAHRIAVLHRGVLVEEGTGDEVLGAPKHPYTQRLLASLPVPDPIEQAARREQWRNLRAQD